MPSTTNFGWTTPADTDLVKDGAAAIRTLGNSIDTSFVDLKGGTTGQVLSKNSNTDLDFAWVAQDDSNAIQNAIIDAKGDLIVGTAADTPARLAIGATNGMLLTVDSTTSSGMKWATPAGGGKVLQVVAGEAQAETSTTSNSFSDIGLSATITPSATSSKILVLVSVTGIEKFTTDTAAVIVLHRSDIGAFKSIEEYAGNTGTTTRNNAAGTSMAYLDSPATTSSRTYKVQFSSRSNTNGVLVMKGNCVSTIVLLEIGA